MIFLLLHLLGLGWLLFHPLYWLLHLVCAVGAVWLLHRKGYTKDERELTLRGVLLAAVCAFDWGTGIFVAVLLPGRTAPGPVPAGPSPYRQ